MYSRRDFIKVLGIGGLVVLSPIPVFANDKYKDFDPNKHHGGSMVTGYHHYDEKVVKKDLAEAYIKLTKKMAERIPAEYQDQVKWIVVRPERKSEFGNPLGVCGVLAWRYVPGGKDDTYPIIVMGSSAKNAAEEYGYLNV